MLKKKTKFIVILLAILLVFSGFSFATDEGVMPISETSEEKPIEPRDTETSTETSETQTNEQAEIYNGDLYLFENDVTMDKLVDGNVFIFGNNVKITGKVNGCLFVCANDLTFDEDSYVIQSIYACANTIKFNCIVQVDLYASCRQLDMSDDSFVGRDLRLCADTLNFSSGVGRNAFVYVNNFNFMAESDPIIYGDLTYTSSRELNLSQELVQGNISYKQDMANKQAPIGEIVIDNIIELCSSLLYVAVVFVLAILLAPKFMEKASSYVTPSTSAKVFGIGILALILAIVASFILLFSVIGIPVSLAIVALLVLLLSIATAVTCICITYKLKEKFAYSKNYLTYLTLAGVVIVIWVLKLIPYIGWVISFVVKMIGLGIIVYYLISKNKPMKNTNKQISTEEKKEHKQKKDTTTKKENKKKEE